MDGTPTLLVYRPGTEVTIGGSIRGYVTAATVRDGPAVSYEVRWFVDGAAYSDWFAGHEVRPDGVAGGPMLPIGFAVS